MSTLPLTLQARSPMKALPWAVPIAVLLFVLPHAIDPYKTILLSYGLVMGIAALGFNLLLGYTGLLSFGHSAYFGVGAYAVAMMFKYLHVRSMELFLLGAILASLVVSALFGFVCVRYTRIFFGILTLALSQVLWSLAFKFYPITGGTDGLRVPTPTLLGLPLDTGGDKILFLARNYYYYVLGFFLACVLMMWIIVHSPFGKALQAIRDNETRAEFIGIHIRRYRFVAFLVSGVFTGIAGALWVPLNGLTTPDILYWPFSGEIVFMTVLGGFRTFSGPIIGAVAFNYLKTSAVGFTTYWQALLGAILVFLVLALDFSVNEGEVLALIGSNGAGKTSLVNVISGLLRPDSGSIVFRGADVTGLSVHDRIHAGIARSFQLVNLFDQLTLLDNVALSIFSREDLTRKLLSLADHHHAVWQEAFEILRQFGLAVSSTQLAGGISQGERKLLDVAVAFALRPRLLFLDEPTSGVSTREKAPIMDVITSVVRSNNITAVIIEHDMDVVFKYSDRIVAMHQGSILASGTPDEIRRNEAVTTNLLGTAHA